MAAGGLEEVGPFPTTSGGSKPDVPLGSFWTLWSFSVWLPVCKCPALSFMFDCALFVPPGLFPLGRLAWFWVGSVVYPSYAWRYAPFCWPWLPWEPSPYRYLLLAPLLFTPCATIPPLGSPEWTLIYAYGPGCNIWPLWPRTVCPPTILLTIWFGYCYPFLAPPYREGIGLALYL